MFEILGSIITCYMVLVALQFIFGFIPSVITKRWFITLSHLVTPITALIKKYVPQVVVGTHDLSPVVLLVVLFALQKLVPLLSTMI